MSQAKKSVFVALIFLFIYTIYLYAPLPNMPFIYLAPSYLTALAVYLMNLLNTALIALITLFHHAVGQYAFYLTQIQLSYLHHCVGNNTFSYTSPLAATASFISNDGPIVRSTLSRNEMCLAFSGQAVGLLTVLHAIVGSYLIIKITMFFVKVVVYLLGEGKKVVSETVGFLRGSLKQKRETWEEFKDDMDVLKTFVVSRLEFYFGSVAEWVGMLKGGGGESIFTWRVAGLFNHYNAVVEPMFAEAQKKAEEERAEWSGEETEEEEPSSVSSR